MNNEYMLVIMILGFCFIFITVILVIGYVAYKGYQTNKLLEKAALALGDDFYLTGIPNTAWKQYAPSFHEYRRLLHALAESGDLSPDNVRKFVMSFTGGRFPLKATNEIPAAHTQHFCEQPEEDTTMPGKPYSETIGSLGYQQIGNDNGYINYSHNDPSITQFD